MLRLGTYQSVSSRILPGLMREFSAAWPRVEVRLFEVHSDDLLPLVERGELDLTFEVLPLAEGPFETVELMRDPYVLLVAADSPLAQREAPPTTREMASLPLISYRSSREATHLDELVRGHGNEPRVIFRSDDNGAVQAMVAAGLGVALVPRLAVDVRDPGVVARLLGDAVPRQSAVPGVAPRSVSVTGGAGVCRRGGAPVSRAEPLSWLLHGDALGQVARLVGVQAAAAGPARRPAPAAARR